MTIKYVQIYKKLAFLEMATLLKYPCSRPNKDTLFVQVASSSVKLPDGQFDALVSFTYNLGGGALQRLTLRRKISREEHADVPEQFMRWVWAGGRKLKRLIRRREAEVTLYNNHI